MKKITQIILILTCIVIIITILMIFGVIEPINFISEKQKTQPNQQTFTSNSLTEVVGANPTVIDSTFIKHCIDKSNSPIFNYYKIFNKHTLFGKCLPHGTIVYVIEVNEFYLCKRNDADKTIRTGDVRKLNGYKPWLTISKEDLEWLSRKR